MAKKLIALFLVLVTTMSLMLIPANAATRSSGLNTQTITVSTKANWWYPGSESITLSASKGTFRYDKTNFWGSPTGKTDTKKVYGTWDVKVRATDGSHSFSKNFDGGSIKLNLKPNKTYKITVSYDYTAEFFTSVNYRNFRWTTYPSWRVSNTHKVTSYY